MTNPRVQVQKIIHDGLVGDRFLRNFTATHDLPNSRVIFAVPRSFPHAPECTPRDRSVPSSPLSHASLGRSPPGNGCP